MINTKRLILISLTLSFTTATMAHNNTLKISAHQKVIKAITLKKISNLIFPDAIQGTAQYTVPAGKNENQNNASFKIFGEPNSNAHIILPADNSVEMIHLDGKDKIKIKKFNSSHKNITLDKNGEFKVYVGATREAISNTKKAGLYSGIFTVTVLY